MKSVFSWAIRNTPAMNTLVVSILLIGAVSLANLRREVFPEFELEIILVSVPYPGASPAEVEEGICLKIEEATRSLQHVKKTTSVAREGSGFVVLELEADVPDVQKVLNEVRSEIDQIPSFPDLAEDPEVQQITLREPAIYVGVIGPEVSQSTPDAEFQADLALREVAESVRDDLLQLPAVSQADIVNGREYQIDIEVAEETLRKYGLSLTEISRIVARENVELPGGLMKTDSQEVLLRGKNKHLTGAQIAKLPAVTDPTGLVLTLGEIADVHDGFADTTNINRINGEPGLVVSVNRTSTEDLLAMTDAVHRYVREKEMPAGYRLVSFADRSVEVRDRLNMLTVNGIQGLFLVFLALAIFLDLKLAFWVAAGIPVSLLGGSAVLWFTGETLNMLSMFSFLMVLGIVVDDGIVIGENIYTHRQLGKPFIQAAIDGAYEVLPSVFASVATTIIAFLPLFFVTGVMGKFIAVMPLAIIATLLVSLIEATFVLPCHLAEGGVPSAANDGLAGMTRRILARFSPTIRRTVGALLIAFAVALDFFLYPFRRIASFSRRVNHGAERRLNAVVERFYAPLLGWAIRRPGTVFALALGVLIISAGFVRSGRIPFVIFPKLDSNYVLAKVVYPDGTPGDVTASATRRIEESVRRIDEKYFQEHGEHIVVLTSLAVGEVTGSGTLGPDSRTSGSHVGGVTVELIESEKRNVTSDWLLERWREESGIFPGAESITFGVPQMGPGGKPIEFKLLADAEHWTQLEAAVAEVKHQLGKFDGVVDIGDDSHPGKWEFQIRVKENAQALGVPLSEVAQTVRAAYYGEEVMRLQRGRHEVKLMVRHPEEKRKSLGDFERIHVRAADGTERPLTELADIKVERGYSEINRVDQLRSITVSADIVKGVGNAYQVTQDLRQSFMPRLLQKYPGVRVRWEGQQEQTTESVGSLYIGFLVAMLGMYAMLTFQFKSYVQPMLIMMIIPFGAIGAILGHGLLGLQVTIFTFFGLVALSGVVVNDSIVLIDFINERVRAGGELYETLIESGKRRFRPVLLTSITTMAGLIPLLMERSFQAQVLIPMAAALVFGLMASTILVLFLVPTFYAVYATILSATIHTRELARESAATSIDGANISAFEPSGSAGDRFTPDGSTVPVPEGNSNGNFSHGNGAGHDVESTTQAPVRVL